MRRLAFALVLLAAPLTAHAAGIGLRWNSCRGEANRMFACDRSTGSEVLVGSFVAPTTLNLSGVEANIRVSTADGSTPSWWQLSRESGGCRTSSLSASFDVSTETECDDPWMGQAAGGIGYYGPNAPSIWPDATRSSRAMFIRMAMAIPQGAIQPISGGRQFAAFKLVINHTRTTGGANVECAGCATPACITIDLMKLTTPVAKYDVELTEGITGMGAGNIATWQGGTPTCGAGAAKSSTWADVKRRYK